MRGRRQECAVLDGLLDDVRGGRSRVLVLRGEAGIGKTALLDHAVGSASGFRLARTAGVESEMELAYAGLHQLCAPFADRILGLPPPQRDALSTAFGLRNGDPPNRFLVGLAVLGLLSEAADQSPLLWIVDDAQWLDEASSQSLAFVARRLGPEPVAVVVAARDPTGRHAFEGLDDLVVPGLRERDARALLATALTGPLDEGVRDRIVAETRGNPLALLELPRALTPAEVAGGFGLPTGSSLSGRIEESFRRRLEPLPAATRTLLLVASAEPAGDPVPVWRAAAALGVDPTARNAAGDLVEFGAHVRFRHPLVRSAVYRAASPEERQHAHHALADATDADSDSDRRAWHRAHATAGVDEDVAAELERSAGRARARGGLAAAAAFLERAAELTPDPARRAERALAAAQSKQRAGAPDAALRLVAVSEAGPLDELDRARAELLRAEVTFAVTRGADAPRMLLRAAKRLEPLDPALARDTYLDAFAAAFFADELARGAGVREIAEAVLAADWDQALRGPPLGCDLLLGGIALLTVEGYRTGAPALKLALQAFREEALSDEDALRWLWLACRTARALGDDASWDELSAHQVRLARDAGALSFLPAALAERFSVELFLGDLVAAAALVAETEAVTEATGSHLAPQGALALAAWRGDEAQTLALIEAQRQEVVHRGEGLWLVATEWASALLFNGLGRYEEALAAAEQAVAHPHELGVSTWVPTELIEAAVRSGHPERAAGPLERLTEISDAAGTEWVRGVEARSRALVTEGDAAEALYREAITHLRRTRVRPALARAHLLYGEWLRRVRRRTDAREQLRLAHTMYSDMGMHAFAERARRERVATGENVRKRTPETRDMLTAQEAQIARLAAEGGTNAEIAAQLYISPRTVEWHLRKVFTKLGIGSRIELRAAHFEAGSPVPAA